MRLSAIRLAGFKSFVDRTQLSLPGNLTAVVGPNGCGKSNLIDAVRWVLGESSARQLRGEALSDVIFNGSKTRKPVGRAMIELVFDNADGTITGPYASYAEISVRRELSREGASQFFINGTRCRRKDITELFLGTGLGSRSSYAIIEQGTVSRLIEAQPDELRQMLEETAGISRYKEKRRETEHRIRHTRENLSRLEDLLSEIDERLTKLQRQASAAARFKRYREEQRQLRRQHLGLRWQALQADFDASGSVSDTAAAALAEAEELRQAALTRRTQAQEAAEAAAEKVSRVQADYYAAEADLARREQDQKHTADMLAMREAESARIREEAGRLDGQRSELAGRIETLSAQLTEIEGTLGADGGATRDFDAEVQQAEERTAALADALRELRHQLDAPRTVAATEKVRLEQLARQAERAQQRHDRAAEVLKSLDPQALEAQLGEADGALQDRAAGVARLVAEAEAVRARVQDAREARVRADGELHEGRKAAAALHARVAALEAEQARALGEDDAALREWLEAQGWADAPPLGRQLKVVSGWERAVESVLGPWLQASCVPSDPLALDAPDGRGLRLVDEEEGDLAVPADSLAAQVSGPAAARALLSAVWVADSSEAARRRLHELDSGAAVVTPDGIVRLRGAVQVEAPDAEDGVLLRERLLDQLRGDEARAQEHLAELVENQARSARALHEAEEQQQRLLSELNEARQSESALRSQAAGLRERLDAQRQRQEAAQSERAEAEEQSRGLAAERETAEQRLQQAAASVSELEAQEQDLNRQLTERQAALTQARSGQREARQRLEVLREQRIELASELAASKAALEGLGSRQQQLAEALDEAQAGQDNLRKPLEALAEQLGASRARREEAGDALREARRGQDQTVAQAQAAATAVMDAEQVVRGKQEALQDTRLARERLEARREGLEEQLAESGVTPEQALAEIDGELTLVDCEAELEKLEQRIQRLGAVNLAAVEEYEEENKRAEYLRSQESDLLEALEKLEGAIRQIDNETRTRFRQTYEAVNEKFKVRFPRLFGGGEAYLELTGEDILEAGVRVMARPPGKRNSSIQLLSGGEKALTAVALVFALFELNPAPFCLLDEVDAPLDDANVVRFCEVVREMSEQVQFIVVTHNKVTMELAGQLNGVTMQEPGVSRLVSVDVQEAVAMTD